jgi:hypothetical protein
LGASSMHAAAASAQTSHTPACQVPGATRPVAWFPVGAEVPGACVVVVTSY